MDFEKTGDDSGQQRILSLIFIKKKGGQGSLNGCPLASLGRPYKASGGQNTCFPCPLDRLFGA